MLLPGLDGTGLLFESFLAASPSWAEPHVIRLPSDRARSYRELADHIAPQLPEQPFLLLGESFSGPLSVLLASQCARVLGVVLVATFVTAPAPRWWRGITGLLPMRPPRWSLRYALTGGDRMLAERVQDALSTVEPGVLVSRLRAVLDVDVRDELRQLACPLLVLRPGRDRVVGARSTREILELARHVEVADVAAPHLAMQVAPAACWHAIELWLSRLEVP